jgi:hypothetical protein
LVGKSDWLLFLPNEVVLYFFKFKLRRFKYD